jgi:hypothetical protein
MGIRTIWLLLPVAAFGPTAQAALKIDGHVDEPEWSSAQRITDFKMVLPLTRAPATHPTEAWVLSTPEGLAIAFKNTQPADVPRTRQRMQRDAFVPVDRVNLYVDFDGDGHAGYNFTVTLANDITDATIGNENQFNSDWDADWQHATSEDADSWSAELLIPWSIAPMRKIDGDKRTVGISLDRVVGATNERMDWPGITYGEQRFLSVFSKLELTQYSQSLLTVTPYVSGIYDNVAGDGKIDSGADIFWKPNGQFQLTATINPDFGQVESDQLVVNFSATETFFSDKRPFFTENQGFFDVPFGSRGNADRLIYTRRVSGDVTGALKFNGSLAGFNYGVFAASEADPTGRDFYALRLTREFAKQGFGTMVTEVNNPFDDRQADVFSIDHHWNPTDKFSVNSVFVASSIDQSGTTGRDSGAQTRIDYDAGSGWRHQLYWLHLGKDLQLNDFGYLERNDFNYLRYGVSHRITDLPANSAYSSHDWQWAASIRYNDQGLHLYDALQITLTSNRKDGGNQYSELTWLGPGYDDIITRGHGNVIIPAKLYLYTERFFPRKDKGPWEFYSNLRYAAEGLRGPAHGSLEFDFEPTYHLTEGLSLYAGLDMKHDPDWLVWHDNEQRLATMDADIIFLTAGTTWLINDKQELRVKLQAIGLDAETRQAWDLASDGTPMPSAFPVPSFTVRNMGFQIRYRREIAPLSYLYVAYVRGGSLYDETFGPIDASHELARAFDLRDSEQLFVKLSYRFQL